MNWPIRASRVDGDQFSGSAQEGWSPARREAEVRTSIRRTSNTRLVLPQIRPLVGAFTERWQRARRHLAERNRTTLACCQFAESSGLHKMCCHGNCNRRCQRSGSNTGGRRMGHRMTDDRLISTTSASECVCVCLSVCLSAYLSIGLSVAQAYACARYYVAILKLCHKTQKTRQCRLRSRGTEL